MNYSGRIMIYSVRIVIYSGRIMIYPAGAKSPGTNKDRKALAGLSMPDISVTCSLDFAERANQDE